MQTRIYTVTNTKSGEKSLVRAALPAQAVRIVAGDMFVAAPASQEDLVALLTKGVPVIDSRVADPVQPVLPGTVEG